MKHTVSKIVEVIGIIIGGAILAYFVGYGAHFIYSALSSS
jgi:hypothetical protein